MSMAKAFVMEMQMEGASTRRLLARIPESKFDFKPHAKSKSVRELASHIAESLAWTEVTLKQDELVMDPGSYQPLVAGSHAELMKTFDANLAEAIKQVESTSDGEMMKPWTMKVGGKAVFTMPKAAVLRMFIISHGIHHRGQLDVYLRLLDVPLPQIYGPTADEPDMVPAG